MKDIAPDAAVGDNLRTEVYKDLGQPALREFGDVAGRSVRVLLAPVRAAVWGAEVMERFVEEHVARKLSYTPIERRISPDLMIAGPAFEALRYTHQHAELREMYTNLLVVAMDAERAKEAHPSFVEVIRQLTPDEAKLLSALVTPRRRPSLLPPSDLPTENSGSRPFPFTFREAESLVAGILACPELLENYLDNLVRLAILERVQHDSSYGSPLLRTAASLLGQGYRWTAFGHQFYRACVA